MKTSQKIILVIAGLLIVLLLGLRTGTTYRLSEVMKAGGPELGHTSLFLYGNQVLNSENSGHFSFLLHLGDYKLHAIISVVLLSTIFFVILKKKSQ